MVADSRKMPWLAASVLLGLSAVAQTIVLQAPGSGQGSLYKSLSQIRMAGLG